MTETNTGIRLLLIVLGFWVLMRSVNKDHQGLTLIDRLLGNKSSKNPLISTAPGTTLAATGTGGAVDPFPGATGSRLDMGIDLTGKQFLAPYSSRVIVAKQSDPGWRGGGYLALQNLNNPGQAIYMAEGIAPTVQVGQTVQAGQSVGIPVSNPYNGIVGNIESGPADTSGQPLAKTASNPPGVVQQFYHWLLSLGGPSATSTSHAGCP